MAIHGQYVFLLTNTGLCRIYDMRKGGFAGSLVLASAHAKNHANNACFGVEYSRIIINFLHYMFLNVKLHIDAM